MIRFIMFKLNCRLILDGGTINVTCYEMNFSARSYNLYYTKVFSLLVYINCNAPCHFSLDTPNRVTGKQYRPRSDASKRSVLSGFTLFA